MGGGCNSKRYWLMELLLNHTNYINRFFDLLFYAKVLAQGRGVSPFFCYANANCHLNTGLSLLSKYRVYDPPLLSYARGF